MINILVPKNHFLAPDYPYMEEGILGLPIPVGWGDIHDIVPFLVDVDYLIYKIADHPIQDITEIRSKGVVLGPGSYIEDLPNAEFELAGTPWFAAATTYYFSISGDYAINGTDYLRFKVVPSLVGFQMYEIDGGSNWVIRAGRDLCFDLYGKATLDGEEQLMVSSFHTINYWGDLRDAAARTRLGQEFVTGATSFYATRLAVYIYGQVGTPTGNLWATFYSSIGPEVQQGIEGNHVAFDTGLIPYGIALTFPQYGEDNDLLVDIEAPYPMVTTGAEVIEGLFVDILGKDASLLDAAELANFAHLRTQELKVFVDREITVGQFIGKLEASLLWKFVPLQDGTFATIVFETGEPAGTLHFKDEDFVEGTKFQVVRDVSAIRQNVRVKYDENPSTQVFSIAETRNDFARFFYSNEESIEFETWLKDGADAADLTEDYSGFFEAPQIRVTFTVHGAGLDLLPGRDKVKVTRRRAPWAGGAFTGELFRIMKLVKSPAANTTEITAVLDSQTY